MKVLLIHNYYKTTSGEDLVISKDIEIIKSHGVDIIEYSRNNEETNQFSILERGTLFFSTVYSIRTVRDVSEIVDKSHPDVALVQNVFPLLSPSVYHALYRKRVPVVQLVYNYRLVCPNAILYTKGRICERCVKGNTLHAVRYRCVRNNRILSAMYAASVGMNRKLGRLSSKITAYITPDLFLIRKLGEGGYPTERMFPISNPFDVMEYTPSYPHLGYFVYAGRIVREKGIFTAMRAIQRLPQIELFVIGNGEAREEAEAFARANSLTNVRFLGPKYGNALIDVLKNARAILVPTEWYDNSPLIVHQAFALGKPVIASDINGIPEIVEHEVNGLLFPPGNDRSLSECMNRLVRNEALYDQLGRNARKKAETHFTANARFNRLMETLIFAKENPIWR